MTGFISFTSCEDVNDQSNQEFTPNDKTALTTRGDCDLCPGDDECCCAVWYQPTQTGTFILQFCGTSTAGTACIGAAIGNCPSFSGGGISRTLTTMDNRKTFCVNENSPFYIYNTSTTDTIRIIVSCQIDITPPDTMWLKIPPLQFKYIETNANCEVGPC